ncbi:FACT complex subunit Ssrp1 [Hyalella azteca]|uniref:FACT complex subunit SSRP1 n=1 Tax=Hyalella azteca TaxID=294128 RepID=A0A8B7NLL7_HYAAZ|nr:FACT complex subunit Ssrp1 [Hyalella azteca]
MKDEMSLLEYGEATMEVKSCMVPCKLKLSEQGIAFRNLKTGKAETLAPSDIAVVNWQRLSSGYGIRIFTSNGNLHRFGGFKDSEQSRLEKFFKNTLNKTMTEKEFSVKGWNYGAAKFEGSVLSFEVSNLTSFEIPLHNVSSCTTGKNEVTLEFHQPDEAPTNLMEMRFHIPTSELAGEDPVEAFQQKVSEKASILTATGESLVTFQELHCLTPRGRYDIKCYPTFLQLHGKSFNFNIPVESVLRLFLLPHMDGRHHFFVVSLDPPIKQGQTRYPYLIMMFSGDDEDEIELPLSEEELKEKFDGRLEKEMKGPQFELVSRLFKGLCGRKIVTPGSFLGHSGNPCVGCSYKAAAGHLYPLERGFFYCYKPPIHIRFEEITSVNFARSGSTTRSFDFEVEVKNSGTHTFSSIEKGEYDRLFDYVKSKNLRIKNRGKMDGARHGDDDYLNSDDEPDHYMNRVKADAAKYGDDDDDDEDEESTDEDFAPGEEGSDVAEEFDSDAPDSSDDGSNASGGEDGEKKEKKPKKAKTVSEKPRKKRQKKDRDDNKPKRPQSAYFLWLNAHREEIKRKNPGISITDLSKKAGEMWRELSDKKEWEEKAAEAKSDYDEAMKEYKASGGGKSSGGSDKKSKRNVSSSSSPSKAGSGGGFKSKEYIESEESSDSGEDEAKSKKKTKKSSEVKKESEAEEESSNASDEDMSE